MGRTNLFAYSSIPFSVSFVGKLACCVTTGIDRDQCWSYGVDEIAPVLIK